MDYKKLANLLFPNVTKTREYWEEKYPERDLPEGAAVSRMAPSPTGFVHLGNFVQVLTSERIAHQSGGILYLRIEDTDAKREVKGAVETVINSLKHYSINFDEGATIDGDEGSYGPYRQRQRVEIYHTFAKELVEKGLAYPCFCTEEELAEIHAKQEAQKANFGYFGEWAIWRDRSLQEIEQQLNEGKPWVLRFRSTGSIENKIKFTDLIKGNLELTENDIDHVLLKSDGVPTYHFAHAIDDHLMKTTLVIRGDEWLPSVPLHLQLFYCLGFKAPKYAHMAPMMKQDGEGKRKLSKRKDPEAAVSYYTEEGIPNEAVKEYLLNIANSNFEIWRKQNPEKSMDEFELDLKKMGVSGALFDMVKMLDVSKNVISKYSAEKVYDEVYNWALVYDQELKEMLADKEYGLKVLGIERENVKPRKDIAKWSDVKYSISYLYDNKFDKTGAFEYQKISDSSEIDKIVKTYFEKYYDESDDKQTWFDKMKDLAESLGYAREVKEYKANPDKYPGHVGDISTVIRVKITGRCNTPDLYEILKVLGKERILKRI